MQRLVYGANADAMLTLMLIALYSTRGKAGDACTWCGGKCNAMQKVAGQYRKANRQSTLSGVQLKRGGAIRQALLEAKAVQVLKIKC